MFKIIFAPFPYLELPQYKNRPLLVLTEPSDGLIIVAYITTKTNKSSLPTDIEIEENDENFAETGLLHTSLIRLHKISSIPTNIVDQQIGTLPQELESQLKTKLTKLFNL